MLLCGTYTNAPLKMKVGNATQEILRQPAHLLFAAGLMVDSMWEDWSRDGQFIKAPDMCRFCPTVGRNATGLVKILITRANQNWYGRTV